MTKEDRAAYMREYRLQSLRKQPVNDTPPDQESLQSLRKQVCDLEDSLQSLRKQFTEFTRKQESLQSLRKQDVPPKHEAILEQVSFTPPPESTVLPSESTVLPFTPYFLRPGYHMNEFAVWVKDYKAPVESTLFPIATDVSTPTQVPATAGQYIPQAPTPPSADWLTSPSPVFDPPPFTPTLGIGSGLEIGSL